ncbi:MAG: hypothetical protein A3F26_02605 [Candidatus Ryanbacteria bacterium RIFCSPHIGHO2_12_FULL_47_12b]|uniref:BioF2-like acetyltransferase domain-containing protein n=2 Tax=Candidatus Ryaniibacteriota TaxID=1817914 RepID=A0A1G2H5A8_9BACT|nr:MAG: Methicillin resistance protein [Parcubacteria group bacterium GW2011_GWA2_47_10b]OGZ48396.1 MAG: hypothetical protein A3C83_03295 [Candidatus Ryanbacteria bacterium RIFCSPHIGHO2_02_FULL_47_25]OGZ52136.1 MAG: hypothetical protein A3F26_02605 [Candidatus Ryanbacteria bacterium RIFCSPHIGHO2_12_FULL_47_12b]OGZ56285.1 MAG: hypothetical protein A3J04_04245 [Candidatus Ryanbacteria bacterium RIFCSPLOWO2_02_FULL_47_14]OGZ57674.1 MAG: hypothetical protein A3G60_00770 [Candidatus Ryanbacteria bac
MLECEEIHDGVAFDSLLARTDIPFTQRSFYGEWQKVLGRRVRRFYMREGVNPVARFQIISYAIPAGFEYLYIPHGPVVSDSMPETFLGEFKKTLMAIAKESKALFVRFDLFPPFISKNFEKKLQESFHRAAPVSYRSSFFQPKFDWVLDIAKTEEELLSDMHQKTRYNIGLAKRRGVTTEIITSGLPNAVDTLYEILLETARRDGFSLHPKKYYQSVLEDSERRQNAFLATARYGDTTLVAHLVLIYGKTAHYLFGGSRAEHRNRMPNHLAHWASICEAKRRSCEIYNFGGVSGGDRIYKDWEPLTYFKQRFGGRMVEYSDFYDLVARPIFYHSYVARKRYQSLWRL